MPNNNKTNSSQTTILMKLDNHTNQNTGNNTPPLSRKQY